MKQSSAQFRKFLLLGVLGLMIVPFVQKKFHVVDLKPLHGSINLPIGPEFSIHGWFSGEYQTQKETFLNETFGFRDFCVRINNQIAFSFFDKAKANGVVIGKNNYLFEENYIKAYNGTDFIGVDSTVHRMKRLQFIQDTLSKLNKQIVLVFAAGKGSFYPEFFPDRYNTTPTITNYELHLKLAQLLGINYIDFNNFFIKNKGNSKYPLYPQYGIHWSYYGSCLAADSIIHYIEKIRKVDMPDLFWDKIETGQPRFSDADIAEGMNILFNLKTFDMAYPIVQTQSETGKAKPSLLVVSDSYYWEMFNFGFTNSFSQNQFWFYNKQIYPQSYEAPLETSQIDFAQAIANHDVIIIMATEATLPELGWGFIENAYCFFKGLKTPAEADAEFQKKVDDQRNYIRTDEAWMKEIEKKAALNNISIDSMITLDAIWQIEHNSN